MGTEELWPSPPHALARPGTAESMRGVSLADAAAGLRSVGGDIGRLIAYEGGRVDPRELKRMLELSPQSAAALERLWQLSSVREGGARY